MVADYECPSCNKKIDAIYYYCPSCNKENWLEDFDNLPTYSSCAYCGMDHIILAVTGDEMKDIKYHREN